MICFWGAGNRDPRKFDDPDRFDVTRKNADQHLAFGAGPHQCVGMGLARMEMMALFTALIPRVERFHVHGEERLENNLIRGFESMDVELELA